MGFAQTDLNIHQQFSSETEAHDFLIGSAFRRNGG